MSKNYTDNRGRKITITIEDDWPLLVLAKHNGVKIGHLEFDDYQDSDVPILCHAEINAEYQNAGIASEMFKELIELNNEILVPNFSWVRGTHEYYYSQEGAALISSCIRKKIISPNNIAPC